MDYSAYMTGNENQLQKDLTDIMTSATYSTGDCFVDLHTPSFKTDSQNLVNQLSSKMVDTKDFFAQLDELAQENS